MNTASHTATDVIENRHEASATGLSTVEAKRRLQEQGTNELPEHSAANPILMFLAQFSSPFIYVLMIAAGLSVWLEHLANAIFIGGPFRE